MSPAKKMRQDYDSLAPLSFPVFKDEAKEILNYLKSLSSYELQKLWGCSDKIAQQNIERLDYMDLESSLTPAVLSYDGIAFQYMAPSAFEYSDFDYIQSHLRILSGFYGVLKPMDGVTPYRLDMENKAKVKGTKDLYEFWGDKLYKETIDDDRTIINLASKEYSKCIEKYLSPKDTFITCVFAETVKGKLTQKATFAKMARGEMVRYLAENKIEDPVKMKDFSRLDFHFRSDLSSETEYIFERIPK